MYKIEDIDDYQNRLTEEQKSIVLEHCNQHKIAPVICAWYDDWEDFCSDWVDNLGYSEEDAKDLLDGQDHNKGEFLIFENETIVRFVL